MSQSLVYKVITDRILNLLDQSVVPWRKPWKSRGMPRSLFSGRPYRGVNSIILGSVAYNQPFWLTFKQANAHGAHIRKGEKGWPCVFWKTEEYEDSETGEKKERPILRYYTVFNVEQAEGLEKYLDSQPSENFEPISSCETIVSNMPNSPKVEHGYDMAAYLPREDMVIMPGMQRFISQEEYYSTLFHELVHSTGHSKRLDRRSIKKREEFVFGSDEYSFEELVAEMGSTFLCGSCGIEKPILENSAAYIDNWRKRLSEDNKIVVRAGSAAQKAADYILGKS